MKKYRWNELFLLTILSCIICFSSSCKKDKNDDVENNLSLSFKADFNSESLNIGDSYINAQNQRLKFEKVTYYFSDVEIQNENGEWISVLDVGLHKETEPQIYLQNIPNGNYNTVRFNLGLDPDLNASDPANFDVNHPLSYVNNTYWGWSSKYIFVQLEGRIDSDPTGTNFEEVFLYHVGDDGLQQIVERPINIALNSSTTTELVLNVELASVFNGENPIDIFEENFTHTDDYYPLAVKVIENMADAFSVE